MVQTVTNRASATYENVLIVSPPTLGSTFTCTVTNTLGSDTSNSINITGMPGTMCIGSFHTRKSKPLGFLVAMATIPLYIMSTGHGVPFQVCSKLDV